jgi:hypothetical protein
VIQHGVDGWVLSDYEWFEETGEGVFLYERVVKGVVVEEERTRQQPSKPDHKGWTLS